MWMRSWSPFLLVHGMIQLTNPVHDADFPPPDPQESMMEMRPATGNTADIPPQNINGTLTLKKS
ncbi:BTE_HP_G0020470.mRNA.1.CDS.1 [Saccharomyces cerevisiae]|nr:BTE_HP_G0020470.mRNA.1.CDS.1 [Saccharomyces cerevisiae]CAI6602593.1 BTE_HP_G0020470.mRNA.1.CDS.1 [Saccharomyces cerevisiae]